MEHQDYTHTFITNHTRDLATNLDHSKVKARVLQLQNIQAAAELLRDGKLVAFPTETVYGLGANALSEQALLSIYAAKRRPLSDPIIVHVLDKVQALSLVHTTPEERFLFNALTNEFWPGPLTVILKADLTKVPKVVTAGTGFVGLRSPKQQTARQLIKLSGVPVGAPSANLFGHVSPTEPVHVFNDFYDQEVTILDGSRCEYGLESTVVKVEYVENTSKYRLLVLRQGSLTVERLRKFVESNAELKNLVTVQVKHHVKQEQEYQESPGMMLKHYSPNLPAYLCTSPQLLSQDSSNSRQVLSQVKLGDCVFISFSSEFDDMRQKCTYFKVGENLDIEEKTRDEGEWSEAEDKFCSAEEKKQMKELYYLLRKGQNCEGKKAVVVGWAEKEGQTHENRGALWDKVYRSTENKRVQISVDGSLLVLSNKQKKSQA